MTNHTAAARAHDLVAAYVREQHAIAARKVAELRSYGYPESGYEIEQATAVERAWMVLLDTAYGVGDNSIVIDDGGES